MRCDLCGRELKMGDEVVQERPGEITRAGFQQTEETLIRHSECDE